MSLEFAHPAVEGRNRRARFTLNNFSQFGTGSSIRVVCEAAMRLDNTVSGDQELQWIKENHHHPAVAHFKTLKTEVRLVFFGALRRVENNIAENVRTLEEANAVATMHWFQCKEDILRSRYMLSTLSLDKLMWRPSLGMAVLGEMPR